MPLRTAAPKKKNEAQKAKRTRPRIKKNGQSNSGAIKKEKKKAAKAEEWKCPTQSPVSPTGWQSACMRLQVLIHLNSVLEIRLIFEFLLRFVLILNIHATNLHLKQH